MKTRLIAGLAAIALCSSPLTAKEPKPTGSPSAPGYAPIGRDEQGVWMEAEEDERELKTSKLVIRDAAVSAYLRSVLCRTIGEQSCANVRIYLIRVPEFNASMAANGTLRVYTGLLLRVRDEAELAAVLSHEFTHFEHRHGLNGLKKRRDAASWAAWLTVASGLTNQPRNYFPTFLAAYFSYNRDQERDADLSGIKLLGNAGYRTMAASSIWLRLRDEKDAQAAALGVRSLKDRDYGPFQSHPMDVERMIYLAREGQALAKPDGFEGLAEFRHALTPIWSMLIEDQIKLNDFGASEYLLANLARGDWTGPLLYARAELYRARAKGGDLLTAETLYRQAIVRGDAPAGAWRGLGLTLMRTGNKTEAQTTLAEYLRKAPEAPDRAMLAAIAQGN
ncbi:MAG: M48 family metallopeptidase [Proteobacteria bacterium]|nr:M48 family metallopeptidase [Pseudomonadota bacterium]